MFFLNYKCIGTTKVIFDIQIFLHLELLGYGNKEFPQK